MNPIYHLTAHAWIAGLLLSAQILTNGGAQDVPPPTTAKPAAGTNAPTQGPATNAEANATKAESSTNALGAPNPAEATTGQTPEAAAPGGAEADKGSATNEIQLSLQGASVDMVVQWLAQTTGKSVIKHPRVQCTVTISSSKKLTKREAITLVYRALALEGFNAIESSNSILIVPEDKEPKLNPELLDATRAEIPEGRQRLVKIFPLAHLQAVELKDKLRSVLSDKGTIEVDDRANQLVVTDYNDNLRLLAELIRTFDVAESDSVLQIYQLQYAEAEELSTLLGLILNAQTTGAAQPGRPGMPGMVNVGMPGQMGGQPPPGMPMPGGPPGQVPGQMPQPGGVPPQAGGGGPTTSSLRFWPDKAANRIIAWVPKPRLPEIQRLIDILDTEKPQDIAIRVLPLKNIAAADLVKELAPLYQKLSGRSSKDNIEVAANERSNSLIVLSSEANFKAVEKLVQTLDTEEAIEKVVRTFLLKNADAQDVAKQLQDLNKDQDSSSRYPYYFFSSSMAPKTTRKMSVVADRRRNALVVQAPPGQMEGIEKMIQELDEPVGDDGLAPRIYHLKYVSAVDIEDVLNELFLKKQQQRSYYYFFDDYQEPTADRDVGRLYGKVRITSEPYSNTIIVTSNSKESLAAVEEVLKQLDVPSEAGESTLRVGLKFAKASTVANSINILFAKNGSPLLRPTPQQGQPNNPTFPQPGGNQTSSTQMGFDLEKAVNEEGYYPWLGGPPDPPRTAEGRGGVRPVSDLVGRVRAVADQRSNALLVSANVHFFPEVLKLIEELDAPTDQVLIEARLVEVSSDFLDKLGVRWSPDGSQVFTPEDYDNSFLIQGNANYRKGFGEQTTVNSPASTASALQALTTLRSGVLSGTISMDFLVQFLRRTTDARVLAEPQINIRDNETGRLFVGQQVPIPQNTVVSPLAGQNTSFTYKDVGVVLEVTPHINTAGDVELKIHAESSTVVPGQTVLGGSIFDTRNFRTDLTAKNGQTLVLGGIIQKQVLDTLRKTPILGSIPGLGWAFKKKDKTTRDVELMVFMRPRVTRSPEEAQELLDEIYEKAPNVKKWKDELRSQKK